MKRVLVGGDEAIVLALDAVGIGGRRGRGGLRRVGPAVGKREVGAHAPPRPGPAIRSGMVLYSLYEPRIRSRLLLRYEYSTSQRPHLPSLVIRSSAAHSELSIRPCLQP